MIKSDLRWFETLPFKGTILDVGSLDVNGSLKSVIPVTLGVDIRDGRCVDKVMDGCDLIKEFGEESFDNVVSANTLEHCEDWKGIIWNMYHVCKKGGIVALSTCTTGKGKHNYPHDYWRFTMEMFDKVFEGNTLLSRKIDDNRWLRIAIRRDGVLKPIEVEAIEMSPKLDNKCNHLALTKLEDLSPEMR